MAGFSPSRPTRALRPLLWLSLGCWALLTACAADVQGPVPVVNGISPSAICNEQLVTEVRISGEKLSPLPVGTLADSAELVLPDVTFSPVVDLTGQATALDPVVFSGQPENAADSPVTWESNQTLIVSVDEALALPTGLFSVSVTNPNGEQVDFANSLLVVPPPSIDSVEPELICVADGARSLTISGSYFLVMGAGDSAELPTVLIDDTPFVPQVDSADCVDIPLRPTPASICSALTIEIPTTMPVATYSVSVTNPGAASCNSTEQFELYVVPPPTLVSIVPSQICLEQDDVELTVTGTDFLRIGEAFPALYLDDGVAVPYTPSNVTDLTGCVDFPGPEATVEVCTGFVVTVPQDVNATDVTTYSAWVENPMPAGCTSEETTVTRYPEGQITNVVTLDLCTGGGVVTVEGVDLAPSAQIFVGPVAADSVVVAPDGSSATAYFPLLMPGDHDVIFQNAAGCIHELAQDENVGLGGTGFFVDPPVVFNGITTRVTIYASDLTDPVAVELVPVNGGNPISLINIDSSNPDKIRATIPAHDPPTTEVPPGEYHVQLTGANGGCERALLTDAVTITDQTTIDLTNINPGFAWTGHVTPVTITGSSGGDSFQAVPRVYLNPTSGMGTAVAVEAVAFLDGLTLTAQIPTGLTAGIYDVIVVNPDGAVGVSDQNEERLLVVADPPPRIDSISPGFVLDNTLVNLTVTGDHFDTAPLPTVELLCETSTGATWVTEVNETASDGTTLDGTFTITQTTEAFCVVRVTNADQTFDLFSSLVVVNNDQKLFPFRAGPDMNVARRGLAAAAGRATNAARYVYAIGGDDGTNAEAFDTVETAAVDITGTPYAFNVLQDRLTTPRALLGAATVGRFVYAIGGSSNDTDPAATLRSVERAYVLSPDERPSITGVDLEVNNDGGTGEGLGEGTWYYRVAAVMPAGDDFNPGGESLPSEAFVVRLPDLSTYKVRVTLSWSAVAGAETYRIYRSPTGDNPAGAEALAFETVDNRTSDTDHGSVTTAQVPLQVGALGKWHTVDTGGPPLQLNTARKGAAVIAAMDPNGTHFNIYVLLGHDGTQLLNSYEWARLSIDGQGRQDVVSNFAEVTPSGPALTGRWQTSAWVATPQNSPNVGAAHYLYLGGGDVGTANPNDDLDVAVIDWASNGALTTGFSSAGGSSDMQQQSGYGAVIANNYLYSFGGKQNIDASDVCHQTYICNDDGLGCTGKFAPETDNWTNTEATMIEPRRLMGLAVESAFIYVLGGQSTGGPTATTEMTVW